MTPFQSFLRCSFQPEILRAALDFPQQHILDSDSVVFTNQQKNGFQNITDIYCCPTTHHHKHQRHMLTKTQSLQTTHQYNVTRKQQPEHTSDIFSEWRPTNALLKHFCRFLGESPRWLAVVGQHERALKEIKRAAAWNKVILPPDHELLQIMHKIQQQVTLKHFH